MASKVIIEVTDDLDGSKAEGTFTFSLEGFSYEIDLSKAHAQELRAALEPYIKAGRRTGGRRVRRSSSTAATDGDQTKAIRDWAKGKGLRVSDRGRISAEIQDAYNKAH